MGDITMDNTNFASTTFDNLDLNALSSTKEEMDAKQDLGLHQKNGEEEQKRKEGLQAISSAIQKKKKNTDLSFIHPKQEDKEEKGIHLSESGCYGMVVLFLDDRGILFSWCEMTYEMYILGFNIMESLANFIYYPKKRCVIDEDTGFEFFIFAFLEKTWLTCTILTLTCPRISSEGKRSLFAGEFLLGSVSFIQQINNLTKPFKLKSLILDDVQSLQQLLLKSEIGSDDILHYIKEYIMKEKRVKYLAIKDNEKELFDLKDEEESKLHI
ncbi:hypothetical protein RhiirA1_509313 [Rhizophagus irregularis]|uniref:Uncharacterized protein n=1 Tax=Rhizophagus irregularis TaxID=588596 RepID=A0A2N0RW97_9GLOM|nr:hypothetical protein RhiirA1_509313 [Rhizophagus irregularis]